MDNLKLYTREDIDTDGSKYLVKLAEVYCYKNHNKQLNAIFKRFSDNLEPGLYIIGNYLYFTLENAKYYTILSCWDTEWDEIPKLIQKLKQSGLVSNIAYEPGHLDQY